LQSPDQGTLPAGACLIVFDDLLDRRICPEVSPVQCCVLLTSRPPSSQALLDRFRISAIDCPEPPPQAEVGLEGAIPSLDELLAKWLVPFPRGGWCIRMSPKNSTKGPSFDDEGLAEVSREVGRDL
jgi:hypothetical protein